jgi:hypothetical protein
VLVSIFILLCCLGGLIYWLRSSVQTLLDSREAVAEARRVAEINHLEFLSVRRALEAPVGAIDYGKLSAALRHDFLALSYLLRFAATVNVGRYSNEERLLVLDYHLMRFVGALGHWFSPELAHRALREMTDVMEHFAAVIGRRISSFEMETLGAEVG